MLLVTGAARGQAITALGSFNNTNGAYPWAGVVRDGAGHLYGVTQLGGASGVGTIFTVPEAGGAITALASFSQLNGETPRGGLVRNAAGDLFGTTILGGPQNRGVVFGLASGATVPTTLAYCRFDTGNSPYGSLFMDSLGALWGTANTGGGFGTIFRVDPGSDVPATIASFTFANGASPSSGLVADGSGALYGTTQSGGANGRGVVFKLSPGASDITVLASFDANSGDEPWGSVVLDEQGNIYGTTNRGGATNNGTLFKVPAGSGMVVTLQSFIVTNGAAPIGGLLRDAAGHLFGVTQAGGLGDHGVLFRYDPASGVMTTFAFSGGNGSAPRGVTLVADGAGNLYGTTALGGSSNVGVVFKATGFGVVVSPPPCPGDADGNRTVNFADINAVLSNWGAVYPGGSGPGDANLDGVVNFGDVSAVLTNWGVVCP
ncbi:MAG: hypothetical protein JNK58_04095 [Phycisphaerae bacterium]|nr:hypothetical protein [Phycisphaerae bacterium]